MQRLTRGREFAFRLTANPVQTVQRPDKPSEQQTQRLKALADTHEKQRGFRVAHRTAAQQLAWLLARAERHGFTIPAARTGPTIDLEPSAPDGPPAERHPPSPSSPGRPCASPRAATAPASPSPAPPSREGSG
ncbi:type I-E CRISPR-associated protein Cas6/Cse3/CasE [Streptomyces nogalater]